jgi:hypothetical protein
MFTMVNQSSRRVVSAVAAVAVVAFAALTLDQGHLGAMPEGIVEVGELTPINLMQMAAVDLPEIVVRGERIDAPLAMLPEVEIVAERDVQVAEAPVVEPAHIQG